MRLLSARPSAQSQSKILLTVSHFPILGLTLDSTTNLPAIGITPGTILPGVTNTQPRSARMRTRVIPHSISIPHPAMWAAYWTPEPRADELFFINR